MRNSQLGKRPICAESPAGYSPTELDIFSDLKKLINKLNTSQSENAWLDIEDKAIEILKEHSKDFRSACYYCVSSTHINGINGLLDGISIIYDMCVIYWHSAYPDVGKGKARIQSFDWMTEKLDRILKKTSYDNKDKAIIEKSLSVVLDLEQELRIHYGNHATSMRPVRVRLNDMLDDILKKENKKNSKIISERKTEQEDIKNVTTEIKPPPPSLPLKETSSTRLPKWMKISVVIFSIPTIIVMANYLQYEYLKYRVGTAGIKDLPHVLKKVKNQNSFVVDRLQGHILNITEGMIYGWSSDYRKLHNYPIYKEVVGHLDNIYPDSIKIKEIRNQIHLDVTQLEQDFITAQRQFRSTRTAIANIQQEFNGPDYDIAYRYSNTLMPLLGRLEHIANNQNDNESALKAQQLLNSYQFYLASVLDNSITY
ncbi:type VI secretion system ImpA family N-terminal domain-containing protein [Thaumasiovibrio sp. DFM-14]|uniref:type VI secretion system ImpA family N-terminal domain-containing protein n=1 Tax=Thaumasiovibrio sp. DFM-14 TaxID=3384792 RepID=UPI00399F6365